MLDTSTEKLIYDIVFVVLTYRNTEDLRNFIIDSKKVLNCKYKIIVVNSYYDDETNEEFARIANENECDYIAVENKGYGYGNNQGIKLARERYLFKFLIISNPDIVVKQFAIEKIDGMQRHIIAPTIKTIRGKDQNPYYYSRIEFVEWTRYCACKYNNKSMAYIGFAINKLYRVIALKIDRLFNVKKRRIYACHGSFVIIGCEALEKLGQVFDEGMFLFAEENHLARLANEKSIITYMIPDIYVIHKEDGSFGDNKQLMSKYSKESYIYYYEKWKKIKESK